MNGLGPPIRHSKVNFFAQANFLTDKFCAEELAKNAIKFFQNFKNFVKFEEEKNLMPVFPILRSKVHIWRRFLKILRRRASACLQFLEGLLKTRSCFGLHTWIVHAWEMFNGWTCALVNQLVEP